MTNAVPPGWYDDPHVPGQLRWWDGATWTEHIQRAPDPAQSQTGRWHPSQRQPGAGTPGATRWLDPATGMWHGEPPADRASTWHTYDPLRGTAGGSRTPRRGRSGLLLFVVLLAVAGGGFALHRSGALPFLGPGPRFDTLGDACAAIDDVVTEGMRAWDDIAALRSAVEGSNGSPRDNAELYAPSLVDAVNSAFAANDEVTSLVLAAIDTVERNFDEDVTDERRSVERYQVRVRELSAALRERGTALVDGIERGVSDSERERLGERWANALDAASRYAEQSPQTPLLDRYSIEEPECDELLDRSVGLDPLGGSDRVVPAPTPPPSGGIVDGRVTPPTLPPGELVEIGAEPIIRQELAPPCAAAVEPLRALMGRYQSALELPVEELPAMNDALSNGFAACSADDWERYQEFELSPWMSAMPSDEAIEQAQENARGR